MEKLRSPRESDAPTADSELGVGVDSRGIMNSKIKPHNQLLSTKNHF